MALPNEIAEAEMLEPEAAAAADQHVDQAGDEAMIDMEELLDDVGMNVGSGRPC